MAERYRVCPFTPPMTPTKLAHVSASSPKREAAPAETGADLRISGADDETRTRDIHLGKVMLYQLSYIRMRVDSIAAA